MKELRVAIIGTMAGKRDDRRVRRARPIVRVEVPPGPLADLKDLLYELYVMAGTPTLDDLVAQIADDDDLPGAPERDTVRRSIAGRELLANQHDTVSVGRILARMAGLDESDVGARVRDLWVGAKLNRPVGRPVREVTDPFALEIHESIEVGEGPVHPRLPLYVRREHDEKLRELVSRAVAGQSVIAVLVGGSSTGKSRACWEVLDELPDNWRLWHPIDPTRPDSVAAAVQQVSPYTVVWLSDAQHYLMPPSVALGEQVAAGLRELLRSPGNAPVLILATIWPEYWDVLTAPPVPPGSDPHSQARALLTGAAIRIPQTFGEADLHTVQAYMYDDPRLREALTNAEGGEITQYLAGGPALIERYLTAQPTARALIHVAMDTRRLGYGPILTHDFIEAASPGYFTNEQWATLGEDWFDVALEYDGRTCRGARGPLSPVRPSPGDYTGATGYRLADYLEQHMQSSRRNEQMPASLWDALVAFGQSDDFPALAIAAEERHLYRHAAQLHLRAVHTDDLDSVFGVARLLAAAGWLDESLDWYEYAADRGAREALIDAAYALSDAGRIDDALDYWERVWEVGEGNRADFALLAAARMLADAGRLQEALDWYERGADTDNFVWCSHVLKARGWRDYRPPRGRFDNVIQVPFGNTSSHLAILDAARRLAEAGKLDEALDWYERAADTENSQVMSYYRHYLANDPEALVEMADWLRGQLAFSSQDGTSLVTLGHGLTDSPPLRRGGRVWNDESSPEYVFRAAAMRGRRDAILHCAQMFIENDRPSEAVDWLLLIEAGDVDGLESASRLLSFPGVVRSARDYLSTLGESALEDALIASAPETAVSGIEIPPSDRRSRIGGPANTLDYWEFRDDWLGRSDFREITRVSTSDEELNKLRRIVESGDQDIELLVASLYALDRRLDALRYCLRAAECNARDGSHYANAIDLLRECGRPDDAERLRRYGIQPIGHIADPWGPADIAVGGNPSPAADDDESAIRDALLRRWHNGDDRYGRAAISAAVELIRCGYLSVLSTELIGAAVRQVRVTPPGDQWLTRALAWACTPVRGDRAPLHYDDLHGGFRLAPALLDEAVGDPALQPVPDAIWAVVLDQAPQALYASVCAAALAAGRLDLAERIGRRAAATGSPTDLYNLSVVLQKRGNNLEAADYLHRSAETGEPIALSAIADARTAHGDIEGAIEYYEEAIRAGHSGSLVSLGVLHYRNEHYEEAEALFRRGADRGEPVAAHNLAVLFEQRGERDRSEELFRRATDADYVPAMSGMANLLLEQRRLDEAEVWYRRAIDAGGKAHGNLAVLLERRGRHGEALQLYRAAAEAYETRAIYNLGQLLCELGRYTEAEAAFRRGADQGDSSAMNRLGLLVQRRGATSEAETWFRSAIQSGYGRALNNLALLLSERSDCLGEAIGLYEEAIEHGDAAAMNNLGLLLAEQGDYDKAEKLFRDAIAGGDPKAASNLERVIEGRCSIRFQPDVDSSVTDRGDIG